MWWLIPYGALLINILIICFMRKRLTIQEIYVTWFVIVAINLSTDIIFSLYFKMYELDGAGVQLTVHFLELTLGASYGIIFLNFMPRATHKFVLYLLSWVAYSTIFEAVCIKIEFIHHYKWKLWYSVVYYLIAFLFVRWHLHFSLEKSHYLTVNKIWSSITSS